MLSNLRASALAAGAPEWGLGGPHDAGRYSDEPDATGFFAERGGRWESEYGAFFRGWYAGQLLAHGDRVLAEARRVLGGCGVRVLAKLPGVHWWVPSRSRAAELTAGFDACDGGAGYAPVMLMLRRHGAGVCFTCAEMCDDELGPLAGVCRPQSLLLAVRRAAAAAGVPFSAENALPRFDKRAHDQIVSNAFSVTAPGLPRFSEFTYLRMGELLFRHEKWGSFVDFAARMRAGVGAEQPPELLPAALPQAAAAPDAADSSRLLRDVLEPKSKHRSRLLGAEA